MTINTDMNLLESYGKIFDRSRGASGFDPKLLESSQALFNFNASSNTITPKLLNVNALLGGIEFSKDLQAFSLDVQNRIDDILGTDCRYWVLPENLGVEYIVTKWPDDPVLSAVVDKSFINYTSCLRMPKFRYSIKGFQINPDGCVVLRGYDNGNITRVRAALRDAFSWIPSRQSGWAHIPLGRILCKLDESRYRALISECEKSFTSITFEETIAEIHYVHETQWYMVNKSKIATFNLS